MGIDPGVTTGIAIIDSIGNVLNVYSKRDITKADIIRHILRFGKPIVVSSDISATPKAVEKIAIKFGCIVYSPEISPTLNEKREVTKEYYKSVKNDHEVDALFAAMKGWKQYRVLFSKVNEILKIFDRQENFPDIMLKILKDESPNIEDAVREFIEKENQFVSEPLPHTQSDVFVEKLQKKLDEKQKQIDYLQNQNVLLSKALNEARKKINSSRTLPKESIIESHESSIDYIKNIRRIENKGYYPVIEIAKIDSDSLEKINNKIDLYNRIILTDVDENLNLLNSKEIRCMLTFNDLPESEVEKLEFPVIKIGKDDLENLNNIKAIKIDYIEKELADAKRVGLIGWLKSYRKRKD